MKGLEQFRKLSLEIGPYSIPVGAKIDSDLKYGEYKHKDDGKYEGYINAQDEPQGYGRLISKYNKIYEGVFIFENSEIMLNGNGRMIYSDGKYYIGELING